MDKHLFRDETEIDKIKKIIEKLKHDTSLKSSVNTRMNQNLAVIDEEL